MTFTRLLFIALLFFSTGANAGGWWTSAKQLGAQSWEKSRDQARVMLNTGLAAREKTKEMSREARAVLRQSIDKSRGETLSSWQQLRHWLRP